MHGTVPDGTPARATGTRTVSRAMANPNATCPHQPPQQRWHPPASPTALLITPARTPAPLQVRCAHADAPLPPPLPRCPARIAYSIRGVGEQRCEHAWPRVQLPIQVGQLHLGLRAQRRLLGSLLVRRQGGKSAAGRAGRGQRRDRGEIRARATPDGSTAAFGVCRMG